MTHDPCSDDNPHSRDDPYSQLVRPRLERERRVHAQLARLIRSGHDFATLLAYDQPPFTDCTNDNPPFVQYAWRDDLRLQIETQGDQFRDSPYNTTQHRILRDLGYQPPFTLGDEFSNWTILRDGEGCEPRAVASLMLRTLWLVHGVHFEECSTMWLLNMPYWAPIIRVTPTKRDIGAELLQRYRNGTKTP